MSEWDTDRDAYIGDFWQCPGCEKIEMEQGNVPEGMKGAHVGLLPKSLALLRAESLDDPTNVRPPPEAPGL